MISRSVHASVHQRHTYLAKPSNNTIQKDTTSTSGNKITLTLHKQEKSDYSTNINQMQSNVNEREKKHVFSMPNSFEYATYTYDNNISWKSHVDVLCN